MLSYTRKGSFIRNKNEFRLNLFDNEVIEQVYYLLLNTRLPSLFISQKNFILMRLPIFIRKSAKFYFFKMQQLNKV